ASGSRRELQLPRGNPLRQMRPELTYRASDPRIDGGGPCRDETILVWRLGPIRRFHQSRPDSESTFFRGGGETGKSFVLVHVGSDETNRWAFEHAHDWRLVPVN